MTDNQPPPSPRTSPASIDESARLGDSTASLEPMEPDLESLPDLQRRFVEKVMAAAEPSVGEDESVFDYAWDLDH